MKIKRVASYETTDGQVFTDKKAAHKHQAQIDRFEKLKVLVAGGFGTAVYMDVSDVASFILDNADAIRAILPQRAKTEPDFVGEMMAANAAQGQAGAATVQ